MENNIAIGVYKDTIGKFTDIECDIDNGAEIVVDVNLAKEYYTMKFKDDFYSFDDFLNEYTYDDTEDFYLFANDKNGIIEIIA